MAGSDLTAIAEVYARSLLDLATPRGAAADIDREFAEFATYLRLDADFQSFVTSRVIDRDARSRSLDIMLQGRIHDLLLDTLQVLNRKDRLELVTFVQQQYHRLYIHQQGIVEIQVRSAEPLSAAQRARLQQLLADRTRRQVILMEHVVPEMVGGLIVQIGDQQIDVSVARQLRRFHDTLIEHAERHIHAGTNLFEQAQEY